MALSLNITGGGSGSVGEKMLLHAKAIEGIDEPYYMLYYDENYENPIPTSDLITLVQKNIMIRVYEEHEDGDEQYSHTEVLLSSYIALFVNNQIALYTSFGMMFICYDTEL